MVLGCSAHFDFPFWAKQNGIISHKDLTDLGMGKREKAVIASLDAELSGVTQRLVFSFLFFFRSFAHGLGLLLRIASTASTQTYANVYTYLHIMRLSSLVQGETEEHINKSTLALRSNLFGVPCFACCQDSRWDGWGPQPLNPGQILS